jgi:hypothetical protein
MAPSGFLEVSHFLSLSHHPQLSVKTGQEGSKISKGTDHQALSILDWPQRDYSEMSVQTVGNFDYTANFGGSAPKSDNKAFSVE